MHPVRTPFPALVLLAGLGIGASALVAPSLAAPAQASSGQASPSEASPVQASPGGMSADMPGMAMPAAPAVHGARPSPADRTMMDGMARMQHDMDAAPMTGDPDKDFVAMMLPHHQGAVDMAEVELRYGHDPQMRRLAAGIVKAQRTEIDEMRRWQAAHGVARR
ncbi:CopM family metallochaperone [Rhizosaccharibacter radicis]|uniref:DUF305 domain-containing protein n=1 Tax=Rhizosaccharibacter radicis TaxID=2782605 RepID=A0ABT1VZ47_9PROT|nr:DUF305 domain-containing protein [Acetobacteraceae bacterium KSS12]